MPVIDLTSHPCAWCGEANATLCEDCHQYTCRDCKIAVTEEGCVHRQKKIIKSQSWD